MFSLTDRNSDVYNWQGVDVELNLAFDNVLVFLKLIEDEKIDFEYKLRIALKMFVCDMDFLEAVMSHGKLYDFALDMLRDKLNLRLREEDRPVKADSDNDESEEEKDEPVPIYDWEEDAGYIYSSFLFDYGIDLIEQQGKLTWDRFVQLFHDLSENSKMGEAMKYRSCEIPKREKGSDNEERKRIINMKKYYMLEKAKPIIERNEYRAYLRMKKGKQPQKE